MPSDGKLDLLALLVAFGSVEQIQRTSALRPRVSLSQDPRIWWQYAINVVVNEVVHAQRGYTWRFFHERREHRIEYGGLWKRKRLGRQATGGNNQDRPGSDVGGESSQIACSLSLFVRYAALDDGAEASGRTRGSFRLRHHHFIPPHSRATAPKRGSSRAPRAASRPCRCTRRYPSPLLNHQQHSQGRL